MLDQIRTRHFPYVFGAAGVLFALLFFLFYLLIFDSIRDILVRQNARIVSGIKVHVTSVQSQFDRQAKILRLSRAVQRNFAITETQGGKNINVNGLRKFVDSWYRQIDNDVYRAVTYLDVARVPVASMDFSISGDLIGLTDNTVSSRATVGTAIALGGNLKVLTDSWTTLKAGQSGTYSMMFQDSTRVLRTLFTIKGRRSGDLIGYLGVDRNLDQVIPWQRDPDRELLVFDADTGRIVIDSADPGSSGGDVYASYPALFQSLQLEELEHDISAAEYVREGQDFLVTALLMDDPHWVIATTVCLDPLLLDAETRGLILVVASVFFVGLTGLSINALTSRVRRRTDELEKANEIVTAHTEMLEEELQTAHDMQMRLMPQENPVVSGFDIVGHCRPATQVGGDFFQYFTLPDSRLAITLADVTGHGMEAAIPTMVFSGLLDNQIEYTPSPDELMGRLNTSLHRVLERRTFICFSMGELDPHSRRFRLSNGGCPYPYLYRARTGEVEEVNLSAFPLGMRPGSTYATVEVGLEEGDLVVFCSDGIIEASSPVGELYGFERTSECIRQAGLAGLAAQDLMQSLFDEVDKFVGGGQQEDDQTIVAIRSVESS